MGRAGEYTQNVTVSEDEAAEQGGAKQVYQRAVGLLARREHSCHELKCKLEAKDFPAEIVGTVIARLAKEGLQSDERYTESYVRSRAVRGRGQARIRQELKRRGVDDHLINAYLSDQSYDWLQLAVDARQKRFGNNLPEDIHERAKQTRFLQQRGFTHEQIRKIL